MTDILASLDFEDDDFEADDAVEGEELDGDLEEFDGAVDLDDFEMTRQQAEEITEAIKSAATATFVLLAEAHKHKAHQALGYATWAEYVKEEFQISTQRSYQLLALSNVAHEIEDALPEGSTIKLTEKQARDIKRELPKITEQIREETADLTPDAAAARAAEIVEEHRDEIKAQKAAEEKAAKEKEQALADAEEEGRRAALEEVADALLEADQPNGMTDNADDGLLELEVDGDGEEGGTALSAEDNMNLYNFFNSLGAFYELPEPDVFIEKIPPERFEEIDGKLLEVTAWLNRFQTLCELRDR